MCEQEEELLPWIEIYAAFALCILFGITNRTFKQAAATQRLKRIEVYALLAWSFGNVLFAYI